jgi:hypothetical protein
MHSVGLDKFGTSVATIEGIELRGESQCPWAVQGAGCTGRSRAAAVSQATPSALRVTAVTISFARSNGW